jgi:glycosyltransferase involved in cell wall biosynthesis
MSPVLHLLSNAADPTSWDMLGILQQRDGAGAHSICCLDARTSRVLGQHRGLKSHVARHRSWPLSYLSRSLAGLTNATRPQVLHAWDVPSAIVAATQSPELPLVLTMLDPALCKDAARWVRSFPKKIAIVASNQVVRSRLLAAGMESTRVVVIRGPVNFAEINEARTVDQRKLLIKSGGPVILMHGPASHDGGQFQGLWAAAIIRQIYRDLRIIIPYTSKETNRLRRFVRSIGYEDMLIRPDEGWTWPRLAACADVFLAPAVDDINTEPLAAAMAAGTVIIATALRSTTELIADRSNGLLVKNADPTLLAARILTALEDSDLRRRMADTARAQAYEVFGVRSFVDHYERLYENLLADRPPGDGIVDTAMAA